MTGGFALVELQDNLSADVPLGDTQKLRSRMLAWTKAT